MVKSKRLKQMGLIGVLATALSLNSCSDKTDGTSMEENLQKVDQVVDLPTVANKFLREFPYRIPGAIDIRKYETPDATYCLVHVRSYHRRVGVAEEINKLTDPVQVDIYKIVSYLAENHDLRDVYFGGFLLDMEKDLNQPGEFERFFTGSVGKQARQQAGSVGLLALEGKIWVKATDTDLSFFLGEREIWNGKAPEILALDNREDLLLQLIADEDFIFPRNNKDIAVAVYGGSHAFGGTESFGESYNMEGRTSYYDNIAYWNKWHTDKFSLIEITPKSYDETDKKIQTLSKNKGDNH